MSFIDVTGKTEEEAIRKALEQLQKDRDDVSVEILERAKSGFLGIGSSPAKVRVTYADPEPAAASVPEKKAEPKPEKKPDRPQQPPKAAAPAKTEKPEKKAKPRRTEARPQGGRRLHRRERRAHRRLPRGSAAAHEQQCPRQGL